VRYSDASILNWTSTDEAVAGSLSVYHKVHVW